MGAVRGVGGVRGALQAGRECRYSGARRCIGSIRGHWGAPRRCRGVGGMEELGDIRGVDNVRVHWGRHVDWGPDHIGPQSRVPALPGK